MNLFDDTPPPDALKADVVRALRHRRVLRPPLRVRAARATAGVAAALALVTAGALIGPGLLEPDGGEASPSPHFLMLLYEDDTFRDDPEHMAEYAAWAAGLRAEGRHVFGEKLAPESATVGGSISGGGATGLFIVGAESLEEALALARESPHARYGGTVEVRPIERF